MPMYAFAAEWWISMDSSGIFDYQRPWLHGSPCHAQVSAGQKICGSLHFSEIKSVEGWQSLMDYQKSGISRQKINWEVFWCFLDLLDDFGWNLEWLKLPFFRNRHFVPQWVAFQMFVWCPRVVYASGYVFWCLPWLQCRCLRDSAALLSPVRFTKMITIDY